ncbi:hypothetical protein TrVFT333_004603 [Trichoderma virens FT-333]|nr:hypothetical protein TrVFT333_004603 [Trichoderma virens FT-333]
MNRPPGKRDSESSWKGADADATSPPVAGREGLKSRLVGNGDNSNDVLTLPESPPHESAFAGLKIDEKQIIKAQLDSPSVSVNYFTLYRYADVWDCLIITISALCAIAAGAILPLLSILFGQLTSAFQRVSLNTIAYHDFEAQLNNNVLYFVYIGIAEFATVYVSTNIAYFDNLGAGEITTRITADTNLIQDGISQKIGLTLTAIATFITAFIIAYVKYWKLALICTSTIVCLLLIMSGGSNFIIRFSKLSFQSFANGSTVAEEVISSIRTATAFGTHDRLARQYDSHLRAAEISGIKMQVIQAVMIGSLYAVMFWNYGLGFWQGSRFLVNGEADVGQILTILMAILTGSYSLGNVAPNTQAFNSAVAAAAKIYSTIDRQSPLDPAAEDGETLKHVEGTIELRSVKHIYPSRPDILVMDDISVLIPAGRTTALVGPSGSGKSTIIGLVERFYNPVSGEILLDGHNIQSLNLRWLRNQISLVGQEPVLFSATIFENIKFGLTGTPFENEPEEAKQNRIEEAAKMANAHTFITSLPDGYGTHVGERGFLLSGGQKQRIAIARAIVGDPKILLLDEATSALDTKSEEIVQAALDKAAEGRTTITIAHRLSTIKTADNIVVIVDGKIMEQGTHEELLCTKGEYFKLVEAQKFNDLKEAQYKGNGFVEKDEAAESDISTETISRVPTPHSKGSEATTYNENGVVLGTILMVSTTLTASMVVALAIGWKLALSKKAYERSASYACEATSAIRTVASLSREDDVLATYKAQLEDQARPVLSGLNLTVKPGQFVALVGASGCGKSTTIALLERFYATLSGCIYVDGKDISQLNVNSYRSQLALVSQEPTLYQGTIRSNILGSNDLSVTEEQVIKVCKDANIYDFILSLPEGLDTLVGNKGTMLSGGQKQRVAIARALLRDPKILLLDEATSALDSESERVVQAALDAAARGRTTIAVAHRLSTIQKADVIYVFDQGRIVESGTHHQLIKQKGRYYELVNLQRIEDAA